MVNESYTAMRLRLRDMKISEMAPLARKLSLIGRPKEHRVIHADVSVSSTLRE